MCNIMQSLWHEVFGQTKQAVAFAPVFLSKLKVFLIDSLATIAFEGGLFPRAIAPLLVQVGGLFKTSGDEGVVIVEIQGWPLFPRSTPEDLLALTRGKSASGGALSMGLRSLRCQPSTVKSP